MVKHDKGNDQKLDSVRQKYFSAKVLTYAVEGLRKLDKKLDLFR